MLKKHDEMMSFLPADLNARGSLYEKFELDAGDKPVWFAAGATGALLPGGTLYVFT